MKLVLFLFIIAWVIACVVNPYVLGFIGIIVCGILILMLEKALRSKKIKVFII